MEVGNKYRERDGHKYHQRRFFGNHWRNQFYASAG